MTQSPGDKPKRVGKPDLTVDSGPGATPRAKLAPPRKHHRMRDVRNNPTPPTKCTPDFIDEYCKLAKAGYSRNAISKLLSLKDDTIAKWLHWGSEEGAPDDSVYVVFAARSKEAHRYLIDKALERVSDDVEDYDSKTSVKTAQWVLERRQPADWGPPTVRHENTTNVNVTHVLQLSTRELYRAVLADTDPGAEELEWDGEVLTLGPESGDTGDIEPTEEIE